MIDIWCTLIQDPKKWLYNRANRIKRCYEEFHFLARVHSVLTYVEPFRFDYTWKRIFRAFLWKLNSIFFFIHFFFSVKCINISFISQNCAHCFISQLSHLMLISFNIWHTKSISRPMIFDHKSSIELQHTACLGLFESQPTRLYLYFFLYLYINGWFDAYVFKWHRKKNVVILLRVTQRAHI